MAGTGRLQADPVFQGLTRPVMVLGVSYLYFVMNAGLTLIVYINTQEFKYLFVVGPLIHAVGYLICLKEPRALELLHMRVKMGMKVRQPNRRFHGYTNSYDM